MQPQRSDSGSLEVAKAQSQGDLTQGLMVDKGQRKTQNPGKVRKRRKGLGGLLVQPPHCTHRTETHKAPIIHSCRVRPACRQTWAQLPILPRRFLLSWPLRPARARGGLLGTFTRFHFWFQAPHRVLPCNGLSYSLPSPASHFDAWRLHSQGRS